MLSYPSVETSCEKPVPAEVGGAAGWIFELDANGTVMHSRSFPAAGANREVLEAFGLNFFEDLEGIEDMPELRRRFRSFVTDRRATESFSIADANSGQTRIFLTKTFQTEMSPPSPLVMMEIRNDQLTEHLGGYNGNTTFKLRK